MTCWKTQNPIHITHHCLEEAEAFGRAQVITFLPRATTCRQGYQWLLLPRVVYKASYMWLWLFSITTELFPWGNWFCLGLASNQGYSVWGFVTVDGFTDHYTTTSLALSLLEIHTIATVVCMSKQPVYVLLKYEGSLIIRAFFSGTNSTMEWSAPSEKRCSTEKKFPPFFACTFRWTLPSFYNGCIEIYSLVSIDGTVQPKFCHPIFFASGSPLNFQMVSYSSNGHVFVPLLTYPSKFYKFAHERDSRPRIFLLESEFLILNYYRIEYQKRNIL